jgi:hypothetical protein
MEHSLLKEVSSKSMQAYLNARIYKDLYWPSIFPIKNVPFLTFEGLVADEGSRIAADVVAYNSSAPEKTRKTVNKLSGVIPAIRIKRSMKETDLNTYNVLRSMATSDQIALLELVFGDIDFCVDGVLARLEWLALTAISTGQISLSRSNNSGVVTENVIDFQVPTANKVGVGTVWSDATNGKPVTDIETVMALGRTLGVTFKTILMNPVTFNYLRATAEIKDYAAPFALYGGVRVKRAPGIDVINEALRADGKPVIQIIDANVGIETDLHAISYANPFANSRVSFLATDTLGTTQVGPIAEETNPPKQVIQSKKGPILVSKWSEVDPVKEITKAETNAFPVFTAVDRTILMRTDNTTW